MRRTWAILIFFVVGNILAACSSTIPLRSGAPARPTDPTLGRWEIIPQPVILSALDENGWRIVRIPIAIENRTNRFSHAKIPVGGSKLFTNQVTVTGTVVADYPAELRVATAFKDTHANDIDYISAGPIPPYLPFSATYSENVVTSFFFQAQIPEKSTPVSLVIPGYSQIPLPPSPTQAISISSEASKLATQATKLLGRPFEIPGKAALVVSTITTTRQVESSLNRMAHDRIIITLSLTSTIGLNDSEVDLRATAISDKGILGFPHYDDAIGCNKPPFKMGPSRQITRTLCAILPYNSTGVRVILTGEVNEVYVPGF